jgi:rRNA maturation endonuclease Nob1
MVKRGVVVWIFSTLSFIAAIHTLEAILALFFNKEIILLKSYPIIGVLDVSPLLYLVASAASTLIFWGVACQVAVESPVERFLNKVLSDAKRQSEIECELVEDNRTILDMICETITENSRTLVQIRDLVHNVKSELMTLGPLAEKTEKIGLELEKLKKEIKKVKDNIKKPNVCPSCGKIVLPKFKICPYCGENLQLLPEKIIQLRTYT